MRQIQASITLPLAPRSSLQSPVVINITLSNSTVGNPPNANTVVGAVSVITVDGRRYLGQIALGGVDAIDFVLSNSGLLPCNLLVGSVDVAAGTYNINLIAN